MEKERCRGEEEGDINGLVWRRHSSSSLFRLRRFFSVLSFSTESWRLAFSSDSCLQDNTSINTLDLNLYNRDIITLYDKHS